MHHQSRPPTPDAPPLIGHGLAFSRAPFDALERWATVDDVVHLTFPGRDLYLVTDPALIETVLVDRHDEFTIGRDQRETFAGIEDDAVNASTGDTWRRLRRGLHPAFTWAGLQAYIPRIAARTRDHLTDWTTGDRFDLHTEMRLLTLHILGDTLLGTDTTGDEAIVMDAADALVDRSDPRRFGQLLPDWVPTPTQRRFRRRVAALDTYVADILADKSPGDEDVCSVLLAAHEDGALSMAEVRDNTTAMLLAGHDSTAAALTYAWRALNCHPAVAARLREEYATVVDDEEFDADHVDALDLTRRVVDETLRLYPPTWAVNRETRDQLTLGGYTLPAGAQLTMPNWVLHRDEQYWDDPETFDPDRWTRDRDRPEYAYFPFSGGPRHCVGMRFARLELVTALATMVEAVDLDVETDGELTFAPTLSLRPETDITATVNPS